MSHLSPPRGSGWCYGYAQADKLKFDFICIFCMLCHQSEIACDDYSLWFVYILRILTMEFAVVCRQQVAVNGCCLRLCALPAALSVRSQWPAGSMILWDWQPVPVKSLVGDRWWCSIFLFCCSGCFSGCRPPCFHRCENSRHTVGGRWLNSELINPTNSESAFELDIWDWRRSVDVSLSVILTLLYLTLSSSFPHPCPEAISTRRLPTFVLGHLCPHRFLLFTFSPMLCLHTLLAFGFWPCWMWNIKKSHSLFCGHVSAQRGSSSCS